MLPENLGYLSVCRKTPFLRGIETAIDALQFRWGCNIFAATKPGIYFKRDLCKFGLSFLRPRLRAFQNILESLCRHASIKPGQMGQSGAP